LKSLDNPNLRIKKSRENLAKTCFRKGTYFEKDSTVARDGFFAIQIKEILRFWSKKAEIG
jgi:hypothetical protein